MMDIEIENLTAETILSDQVYEDLFAIEDEWERQKAENKLLLKAREFRVTKIVERNIQTIKRNRQRLEQATRLVEQARTAKITNFFQDDEEQKYPPMYCGTWFCTENGISSGGDYGQIGDVVCFHPIMPIRRLKNIETEEEQIVLAYKRNNVWHELTVPKTIIASASKIVDLAKYGVLVTSENARLLVRFLMDLESFNESDIPIKDSTSKLGWRRNNTMFLPYDKEIQFDGEIRFRQLFGSIAESGEYQEWLKIALDVRKKDIIVPRIALAASFASILLKLTGSLPFIVDFWGQTEGGKTVTLMLAASVWANPTESRFIGDFKTTDVALEVRCDMLNSLPLILDDTSKATPRIRENFESLVYDLCSGKGKSRSNKELGANRECYWQNITICNGERPLSEYVDQGGAINRIIDVECGERIFDDPQYVAETVKRNYGFAGRMFVEHVKKLPTDEIKTIQKDFEQALTTDETMQKQVIAMAALLTADKIATDCIFQDGRNLRPEDVMCVLTNRSFVAEGARCYQYILDCLDEYSQHFISERINPDYNGDVWGEINYREKIVNFIPAALEDMIGRRGFHRKPFTSWARKMGLLIADAATRDTKVVRMGNGTKRVISLTIDHDFQDRTDSFQAISEAESMFPD